MLRSWPPKTPRLTADPSDIHKLEGMWSSRTNGLAVAACNGTSALFAALSALGVGPGCKVVVPAYGFSGSVIAAGLTGAEVTYCDCDPETGLLDLSSLESVLKSERPAAVMPVHIHGQQAPVREVVRLAAEVGAVVVEDSCQSSPPAPLEGHAAAVSFNRTKAVPAGEGGVAILRGDGAPASAEMLVSKARAALNFGVYAGGPAYSAVRGVSGKMAPVAAAAALHFTSELPKTDRRARAAGRAAFDAVLGRGGRCACAFSTDQQALAAHRFHKFGIHAGVRADEAVRRLERAGVPCHRWMTTALHLMPGLPTREVGAFPGAEAFAESALFVGTETNPLFAQKPKAAVELVTKVLEILR